MSIWIQLAAGSLVLAFCVVVHVATLGVGIEAMQTIGLANVTETGALRWIGFLLFGTLVALIGHSLQVWVWAAAFRVLGAMNRLDEAVYFSIVTSTTLGYGDMTLGPRFRVFGAMAAVNGLMTFGLSTAFLVGLTTALHGGGA